MPEQLMRAMAAEAEAAREARAKVIAAEGEHKASRSEVKKCLLMLCKLTTQVVSIFFIF